MDDLLLKESFILIVLHLNIFLPTKKTSFFNIRTNLSTGNDRLFCRISFTTEKIVNHTKSTSIRIYGHFYKKDAHKNNEQ